MGDERFLPSTSLCHAKWSSRRHVEIPIESRTVGANAAADFARSMEGKHLPSSTFSAQILCCHSGRDSTYSARILCCGLMYHRDSDGMHRGIFDFSCEIVFFQCGSVTWCIAGIQTGGIVLHHPLFLKGSNYV